MDTLSLVSKYLNGMEDILDDGDSLEARKLTVEKSKEELELFEALDHKSVIVNEESHRVVVFKKVLPHAYSEPFTRFSLPCDVDGQDYGKYGRKMVREVHVEIHGFTFLVDFVVIGYANKGEPSVIFGRDFLVTSKSKVDFGIGEMRIDLTMLEEIKDIDVMLNKLVENLEEVVEMIPKKMCDQGNFALPMKVNGTIEMNALADTGESVSVLPYCLFMNLGLEDPKPYNTPVDIPVDKEQECQELDKELTLLLGCPFWRTCGAVIDMGRGTLCIDDGVIRHTYFPKLRAKAYLDNFAQEEEDDWLSCFEVGRDEDVNPKYGPVVPSFLDIEDDMERALAMEAYFNPLKNIIIFKKLIDFLGSLPVQLKNTDWVNEGYGTYKKVEAMKLGMRNLK
ncbi:zinc finger, CCHC-type containing protein [Tanacetum coccineum]